MLSKLAPWPYLKLTFLMLTLFSPLATSACGNDNAGSEDCGGSDDDGSGCSACTDSETTFCETGALGAGCTYSIRYGLPDMFVSLPMASVVPTSGSLVGFALLTCVTSSVCFGLIDFAFATVVVSFLAGKR